MASASAPIIIKRVRFMLFSLLLERRSPPQRTAITGRFTAPVTGWNWRHYKIRSFELATDQADSPTTMTKITASITAYSAMS